jgi:HK97 family phage major capsid protein
VPYTNIIDRTDAGALIPAEAANEVIKAAAQQSAALALCRTARMSSKVYSQPVLSALPVAYWVPGDSGLKQTSESAWAGIDLTAEELAVVVPCPQNVLDDASFDIWAEVTPGIGQAFAQKIDAAVFAGTDKPASWPAAIIPGATTAGNVGVADSTAANGGVIADLGELLDLVEADGFDASGFAANRTLRGLVRKARSTTGELLGEGSTSDVWDLPIQYAVSGSFPAGPPASLAVAGDWSMAVIGVRQDMRVEVFREGVISDDTGKVILNLMQQDSAALRATGRFAFQVAVPVTLTAGGTRYPFAVMNAAA